MNYYDSNNTNWAVLIMLLIAAIFGYLCLTELTGCAKYDIDNQTRVDLAEIQAKEQSCIIKH